MCGLYVEVIEDSIDARGGVFSEELLLPAQSLLLRELSLFVPQTWEGADRKGGGQAALA